MLEGWKKIKNIGNRIDLKTERAKKLQQGETEEQKEKDREESLASGEWKSLDQRSL